MTLVEILVVMAIMVMMAAITAAFYPSTAADTQATRFSNTIQAALVSVRNRSKSEKLPTGIRLYRDATTKMCNGVVLIQKPTDLKGQSFDPLYPGGIYIKANNVFKGMTTIQGGVVSFYYNQGTILAPNMQMYPVYSNRAGSSIKEGDLIRLDEGGDVCMLYGSAVDVFPKIGVPLGPIPVAGNCIQDGATQRPTEITLPTGEKISPDASAIAVNENGTANTRFMSSGFYSKLSNAGVMGLKSYTIIRKPVEVSGDPPFELPIEYQISLMDFNNDLNAYNPPKAASFPYWPANTKVQLNPSSQIPSLTQDSTTGAIYTDIYFNESGGLQSPINGDIFLWLHRTDAPPGDPDPYKNDLVIAIRKLTGSVGVFPLGNYTGTYPNGMPDPFYTARDPKNQGL